MKFTYYGHSCFSIMVAGKNILFDPFITDNPMASSIDVNAIHPDIIMVSHGHSDHTGDLFAMALRSNALVVSNFEICSWLEAKGYSNSHPMNIGGAKTFDWGKVKMTTAIHSSSLPDGTYGGNPGGFVVETAEGTFYYSGDTALTYDFKLIGEEYDLDFAILPIGDNFTMGPDDAIRCSEFIKCDKIIGVHYDTFPYIVIDKKNTIKEFDQAGKELILLAIGESIEL